MRQQRKSLKPSVNFGIGPIKWTTGQPLQFNIGGYAYVFIGAGLEINSNIKIDVNKDSYGFTIPHALCFIKGTQVLMCDSQMKEIEKISIGDSILTYNFDLKKIEKKIVNRIDSINHENLVEIEFANNVFITSTQDHPYYVSKKGWCSYKPNLSSKRYNLNVNLLRKGDKCLHLKNGKMKNMKIKSIKIVNSNLLTYNLTGIMDANNYFVNGILVNNESGQ